MCKVHKTHAVEEHVPLPKNAGTDWGNWPTETANQLGFVQFYLWSHSEFFFKSRNVILWFSSFFFFFVVVRFGHALFLVKFPPNTFEGESCSAVVEEFFCLLSLLLLLLLLALCRAIPVVEDLQGDDAVAGRGDDVGEGHQRVARFLRTRATRQGHRWEEE